MAQTEQIREQIPGYDIEKQIGQGGMGTVYLARQQKKRTAGGRQAACRLLGRVR